MFNAPIPGESLTRTPKQYPWERPPKYSDPEEALQFYLSKMNDPDRMEAYMDALELDVPVKTLVEGTLRMGVANGLHTIDVSLLIAPVIHEFIVGFAQELGVSYDDGFEDKEAKKEAQQKVTYLKTKHRLEKQLKNGRISKIPDTSQVTEDNYTKADFAEPEEVPSGFLSRRK